MNSGALRLSDVCEINMGQAPNGDSYNNEGNGLPLIAGAGDFGDLYPKAKKFTTEASKVCDKGDIVLGIRATIGEKVIADGRYCLGRGVAGLRAGPKLDTHYLWHWLAYINPLLVSKARGATFLQVNRGDIGELPISLPPLNEQRRIAAILDKADALRAKRREALAQLDRLAQSIFVEMFGNPVKNSKGWPFRSFNDVCPTRLGKMLDQKQQTGQHSRKYLRNANVQWFRFDLGDLLEMDFDEAARETFALKEGDLLICEGGEPGRAAIWRNQLSDCYYQKALHRGRPDPSLAQAEYLLWLLWCLAKGGGLSDHVTSATIAHLTGQKLKAMRIPLPPLLLQCQFAERLRVHERLRLTAEQALTTQEALFASLQHRAFRGEL